MLIFTTPDVAKGSFKLAIARKSPGKYLLILARAYGMAETRVFAVLNSSTPSSTIAASSASGHPLIWLDTDLDRDPRNLAPPRGVLGALQAADPPVIKLTGRVQRMHAKEGGERDAHEVEIVLSEDQLARCCWYCDALETDIDVRDDERFKSCGGTGYASTYMCQQKSGFARGVSGLLRPFK
uniref:Nonribosomal peptide synthetase 1 (EC) n=1 Tax=Ganoderma boninense TaxID=34458 RepID=A0A5K1JTR9_9APHY|nr:Nonribosomal peptide synthetase 1 (EC [Ganoderma boninense]